MQFMRYYALDSKEQFPSDDTSAQEWRRGTTFYGDFKVAEVYAWSGHEPKALEDTWKRAWKEWKNDAKYVVELCLVMNHMCWEAYNAKDKVRSEWYAEKYHFCKDRIFSSGNKEEPLPKGCVPFTKEEQGFAFKVLD